jgi:hypothetical protein
VKRPLSNQLVGGETPERVVDSHAPVLPPVLPLVLEASKPWLDLASAPRDASTIDLRLSDTVSMPGRWRVTRRREGARWVVVAGWVDPLTLTPLQSEPDAWRPMDWHRYHQAAE